MVNNNKMNNHLSPHSTHWTYKKSTIYDIGNPGPGLRQTDNTTRPIESLTYNLYVLYKIGEEIIIMKKKLKQWWSTIPPTTTKQTTTSQLIEHIKRLHDIWRWKSRTWLEKNQIVLLFFFLFNNLSKIKFLVVLKYILVNKDHVLVIFIF